MNKLFQILGILCSGILLVTAIAYGYSVIYFYASQPENYGHIRFKIFAFICVAFLFLVIGLTLWQLIKILK